MTSADLTLSTDKVPATEGDKKNLRCAYPGNSVKITIELEAK